MIKVEFNTKNLNVENILPIIFDKFDEIGETLDIRDIQTRIEFILITDLNDIEILFEQIKFINTIFKKHVVLTIRLTNLHKLDNYTLSRFADKNITNIDYIIQDLNILNSYEMFKIKLNYLDLLEYDIRVNVFCESITVTQKEILNHIVLNSTESLHIGDKIERYQ